MARIFITGSTDGLGFLSAKSLVEQGHQVVLHGRNANKAQEAIEKLSGAEAVLTDDLSNIGETKKLADHVNALGNFDAVIHNAGVLQASPKDLFHVNTLAPYILTCLVQKPRRLIYLTSQLHAQGHSKLASFKSDISHINYSDTKLHVLMLSMAVARRWPDIFSNAVHPGWVPTKLGGHGAPDDLQKGYETQSWLAVSNDAKAKVSGKYFFHQKESRYNSEADDIILQDKFLDLCKEITGVSFP